MYSKGMSGVRAYSLVGRKEDDCDQKSELSERTS